MFVSRIICDIPILFDVKCVHIKIHVARSILFIIARFYVEWNTFFGKKKAETHLYFQNERINWQQSKHLQETQYKRPRGIKAKSCASITFRGSSSSLFFFCVWCDAISHSKSKRLEIKIFCKTRCRSSGSFDNHGSTIQEKQNWYNTEGSIFVNRDLNVRLHLHSLFVWTIIY